MEDSRYGSQFLSTPRVHNDQGHIHHYGSKQVQTLGRNGENETLSIGISNDTLTALRQQMDHTNHDMVQMLSQQIAIMLKSLVQTTIDSFILLVDQMTRIGDAMAIPQV